MNQSVSSGVAVPVDVEPLIDRFFGGLLTGKTVKVKVRRQSAPAEAFDWSDLTFKALGSVTQLLSPAFTQVSASSFPGEYFLSGGFPLDTIAGLADNDVYQLTIVQDGGTDVANMPQIGEIRVEVALDDATLSRKGMFNQVLSPGSLDNLELLDDDGLTPIGRWNIKDTGDLGIVLPAGFPAKRFRTL